ncbi:MAG: ATPase, T2SS/T4P/T4SS family, partial [Abditibacteriales bacterium]|nr:ATPase, T2SS/T4P/T4SS family [Abditibacteriales bacterium]
MVTTLPRVQDGTVHFPSVEELGDGTNEGSKRFYALKHLLFDDVLAALPSRGTGETNPTVLRTRIDDLINTVASERQLSLSRSERSALANEFLHEVIGFGPLEPLLDEPTVTKIHIVNPAEILVERGGRLTPSGRRFRDEAHLRSIISRIAEALGSHIDTRVPLLDRELSDGSRIQARIPPLSAAPVLIIDKRGGSNPFDLLKRQQQERARSQVAPYLNFKQSVQQRLVQELDQETLKQVTAEELRGTLEALINEVRSEEGIFLTRVEQAQLTADLLNEILGLGPIEPLLNDPDVSEIMVNGPHQVYVERHGKLELTEYKFRDNAHVMQIIERIVSPLGRRIDERSPMVDARLPNGSRVNAIIPPLAIDGPILTIRKFSQDPLTMSDLINMGTLSREAAMFLQAAVETRLNIIVSGGTGSGKTTTLNVLSSFIPPDERIVTIEDAAELQLRQEHVVRLEARPPNVEGMGEVTIRDLVRNALRMRPDRIIVGECRGAEALDMLQAMNTGHDGSLTTAHANSPRELLSRLETMVLMAGLDLPVRAIREQIAGAVRVGEAVEVEVAALPGRRAAGRLAYVAPAVSPETRTVRARMDLP